jgi:Na+/melibiose symporter-like transporter
MHKPAFPNDPRATQAARTAPAPETGIAPLPATTIVLYSVANAGANMVYAFANTAFPLFLATYQLPNLVIGFLAQERSFVGGFVQPVVGAISDRLRGNPLGRRRPFFLIGVPLTAASLILLSFYPPLWVVVALLTVFSFFLAVAYDPYLALLPDMTLPEQRGRVGGVMAVFNMLGQVSMLLLAIFLWDRNPALVFWLVAVGLTGTFAITFVSIREPPPPSEPPRAPLRYDPIAYVKNVLQYRELSKYVLATFFFWFGTGGVVPFLTRFGVDALHLPESQSFIPVLPAVLGTAIFAVPAGLAAERLGKKQVLLVGLLLYGLVGVVGAQIVQDLTQALIIMSIIGLANAITTALIFPLLADLMPPERAGEFTGLGSLVWSLAQPIGAVGAGAMADAMGTLRGAFLAGGFSVLIAFALLLTVHPERVRPSRAAAAGA